MPTLRPIQTLSRFAIVTFATCVAIAHPTLAATEDGSFAARGIGAQQCAVLTEALDGADGTATRDRLSIWISGYLSHANRSVAGTFDTMPIQDHTALAELVANICRGNPDALAETVLFSFLDEIAAGWSDKESDLIAVKAGDLATNLRADVFARVQERLVTRGLLDSKAADGQPGPQTQSALEKFQVEAGLTATGLPDPATLFIMFTGE